MKFKFLTLSFLIVFALPLLSQNTDKDISKRKMEWWRNAKFGMFIHWGIYSVPAGSWEDKTDGGEWIMSSRKVSRAVYGALAQSFNPIKFNADAWVQLAKDAGQKYMVITAKHHDGFAMFQSKASTYNIVDASPFKRDIIMELSKSCKNNDLKFGVYYSHVQDWYNPGGSGNNWDKNSDYSFDEYIDKIAIPQVKELLSKYGTIDEFWWDQSGNITKKEAAKFYTIVQEHPHLITNNRLGGGIDGDIITPEQFIPATGYPRKNWEVCMTINNHWGYCAYDENWKSTRDILLKLVETVSKGGNLLLNVGPNKYGEIPLICQRELREVGRWLKQNGESIYDTESSPFPYLPFGRATKKRNMLYLHILNWNKLISIPYLVKIKKAFLIADKHTNIKHYTKNGYTFFRLPEYAPDNIDAVLAVECEEAIPTQALPTHGINMTVNGKNIAELNDENFHSSFIPHSNKAVIKFSLNKAQIIQCLASIEPWPNWDGIRQNYKLEGFIENKWVELVNGNSDGTGVTLPFEPIKVKDFKLTVTNLTEDLNLEEIMLFN